MAKIGDKTENSSLAGTEKIPLTGSQWAYISTIATYLASRIAVYDGDVVTSGGEIVLT